MRFQSLSRDSVCCDFMDGKQLPINATGFNPSVGILFVATTLLPKHSGSFIFVSIPQSGFCSLRREHGSGADSQGCGFNPSVGILFVATQHPARAKGVSGMFQSLSRDSVRCDLQSITSLLSASGCFNPSVGILFVATQPGGTQRLELVDRFNPSVGILFVATSAYEGQCACLVGFQSLSRDSVRCDLFGRPPS